MRLVLLSLLIALPLCAQVVVRGGVVLKGATAGTEQLSPSLPQAWVNSLEYAGATSNTVNFPTHWQCGETRYPSAGEYANTMAGLQAAINDAETCRAVTDAGTMIVVPAGSTFSAANGLVLPQTAGDSSSKFIVLQSSTPLPTGQTVCSHGIQDNLASSTQPGIRNLGCNGTSLSYQLGTTVTPLSGSFTLANGTATNATAYNDVASMYTIETTGASGNAIYTANPDANGIGPHHYAILNAELRPQAGNVNTAAIVLIGTDTDSTVANLPSHIHIGYVYAHGDWTDAPVSGGVATSFPTGANSIPHNFRFSCVSCSLTYSYTDKSLRPGAEGHVVAFLDTAQFKIVHNWLEGQAISHLCGGTGANLNIPSQTQCTDMEDRANRYTYPYSWILAAQAGFKPNGGVNGFSRKNAHEYKIGTRILLDGNIMENADYTGAQGTTISFKTNQTSSGDQGTNYTTRQDNTTITNNIIRNGCNGASIGFRSGTGVSGGGGVSRNTGFYTYTNNLMYNLSQGNPGCTGAPGPYGIRVAASSGNATWTATAIRDANGLTTTLLLEGGGSGYVTGNNLPTVTTIGTGTGATVNITAVNSFGQITAATISQAGSGYQRNDTFMVTQAGATSTATLTVREITGSGNSGPVSTVVPGIGGKGVSEFAIGDPVLVYGCTDSSFNTGAANNQFTLATPATYGTQQDGLLVTYLNPGTANASTTCTVNNLQGAPYLLLADHNSDFINLIGANTGDPGSPALGSAVQPCIMGRNLSFINMIAVGGGASASALGEGTRTTRCAFDPASLAYHHVAIPGRDTAVTCAGHAAGAGGIAACYTEYTAAHTQVAPPTTLWGTQTPHCTGNDPTTGNCLGIVGNMSTGSFNYALADWHNYRLCKATDAACNNKASVFAAGQANQSSDGEDLGADFTKIEAAQTSSQYPGGYPD